MKTEELLTFLNGWSAAIRGGTPFAVTPMLADRLDDAVSTIVLLQAELSMRDRRKMSGDSPPPIGDRRFEMRRKGDYLPFRVDAEPRRE